MIAHYLIVTSEFPPGPGGIGKHAYSMAKGLLHNGVKVTVVCNMDYAIEDEVNQFINNLPEGITVRRIRRKGFFTYVNRIKTIITLCKNDRFQKVILSGQFSLWMAISLKRKYKNIKVEGFVHGSELFLGGRWKQWLTLKSLKSLDAVYAVSEYTARLTKSLIPGLEMKIIPNGLDITEWDNINSTQKLEWQGYPKLLTVGSITKRKGQHNVINALPVIIKRYPEVHYHIVGLGHDNSDITMLIKQLNLEKHVTLHGRISDIELKKAYNSANIFCMLSESTDQGDVEGFGIAVLEANMMGVAVIGSRNTGIEDAIHENKTGFLVDAHNPSEILKAIEALLRLEKHKLQDYCMSWATAHDWNTLAKQLL